MCIFIYFTHRLKVSDFVLIVSNNTNLMFLQKMADEFGKNNVDVDAAVVLGYLKVTSIIKHLFCP